MIAGSHAMVTQNLDWSLKVETWLAPLVTAGVPVLGICYGHQLLAKAMGGKVDFHPNCLEIGTASITLTADALSDPLLQGLPKVFNAHTCHSQTVLVLPPGRCSWRETPMTLTMHSAWAPLRGAFSFTPEYTPDIMAGYIRNMSPMIQALGKDPATLLQVADTPEAGRLLSRFADLCRYHPVAQ